MWSKVKEDRTQDKIVLLDEVWKLINTNDTVAEYVLELYKTIRGYGGGVVCATQDLTLTSMILMWLELVSDSSMNVPPNSRHALFHSNPFNGAIT